MPLVHVRSPCLEVTHDFLILKVGEVKQSWTWKGSLHTTQTFWTPAVHKERRRQQKLLVKSTKLYEQPLVCPPKIRGSRICKWIRKFATRQDHRVFQNHAARVHRRRNVKHDPLNKKNKMEPTNLNAHTVEKLHMSK